MAEGLTERERYLRRIESLALSALPITELPLVAAPKAHHDGVMVAFVPDAPEELALDHDEALPADDLHVTLCYFGKVQDLSSFDQTKILTKTRSVVDSIGRPFSTTADGVVVMGKNDDGVPATAWLIQSDEIVSMYEALADAVDYKSNFPSFIPHMTTGYGVPVEDAQTRVGQPINFSKVIVKFGDAIHEVPLTGTLVAAPRAANVIDRVIDSLGRLWDEALHPRDGEGRFIKKNGAISGKLAVPTRDRKSVNMVDANRASVVGFHTFGDEVWVLAEITGPDGKKSQGFARATAVKAVAPVKARLDALYPVNDDDRGDAFMNASLERKRQLDLLAGYIFSEYGETPSGERAQEFLGTLGLWERDLEYLNGLGQPDAPLSDDEMDEAEDIVEDARSVKALRDRVHGLREDANYGFVVDDAETAPTKQVAPTVEKLLELAETDRTAFIEAIGGSHRIKYWPSMIYGKHNWNELDNDEKRNIVEVLQKNIGRTDYETYRDLSRLSTRTGADLHQVGDMVRSEQKKLIDAVPVPEGHIRMYRGETPFRPTNKGEENRLGSWWTTDFDYAHSYSRYRKGVDHLHPLAPEESRVLFVDVPEEDVRGGSRNRGGSLGEGGATSEFNLPTEWRDQAKTVDDILAGENDEEIGVHTQPKQQILEGPPPDPEAVAALQSGADPMEVPTDNLLGAMEASGRFTKVEPTSKAGTSPIEWHVDPSDPTGHTVRLAGTDKTTTDRAYFVKQSVVGAEFDNTDIVKEVLASLITEQVADDDRALRVPKSRFGDNPIWDGETPHENLDIENLDKTHQPAHIVSEHAGYAIPEGWIITDMAAEEVRLKNDIRTLDDAGKVDAREAFFEDTGDIFGNDIAKMVLWDFAVLNGDRNPGNAFLAFTPDNSQTMIVPIDHGFAFDEPDLVDDFHGDPNDPESTFEWFMNYKITQGWMNYVLGGLSLDNNVSEATLRGVLENFIATYGRLDAGAIMEAFRSMPGVTEDQVEKVEKDLGAVLDRISWMRDNMDAVLRRLTERRTP